MLRIKFIIFSMWMAVYAFICNAQTDSSRVSEQLQKISTQVPTYVPTPHSTSWGVALDGLEDLLIPIIAIITPFLVGFLVVLFILRYQLNKKKAQYAVIEKALEMGKELPTEFFQAPNKKRSPFEEALVLIAIGCGLLVIGFTTTAILYGVGALCILIGVAKLIAWKIEQRKNQTESRQIDE